MLPADFGYDSCTCVFDEKALFEQAVKREYVNFSCWMLDKMGDTLSMDELPMGLHMVRPCAPGIIRIPGFARFAYNKEMSRQDLVNVFRAGLADCDVEEFVPRPRSFLQPTSPDGSWLGASRRHLKTYAAI